MAYTRTQTRFKVLTNNDTPQMRAAVNLMMAVKSNKQPRAEDLQVLALAVEEVIKGECPIQIFGYPLGLVPPKGRPPLSGFTPSDIVAAVIELELRRLGKVKGAMSKAVAYAMNNFSDIGNDENARRTVYRDWRNSESLVKNLDDQELKDLVSIYYK